MTPAPLVGAMPCIVAVDEGARVATAVSADDVGESGSGVELPEGATGSPGGFEHIGPSPDGVVCNEPVVVVEHARGGPA